MRPVPAYHERVIPGIILAAGLSSRMGRTKALLPLPPDETFLTRIIHTLHDGGVEEIVVVLGHDADAIRQDLERRRAEVRTVINPAYREGQLSSLIAGLDAIDRPDVEAVLVTLVDVPLVSAATVRAVVDCWRREHPPIVRPTRGGRFGHPMLVARDLFDEIRRASPDTGAKPVVRAHATPAGAVAVDDAPSFVDIDTPDAYAELLANLGEVAPRRHTDR